jgi:hypothetical protein
MRVGTALFIVFGVVTVKAVTTWVVTMSASARPIYRFRPTHFFTDA